MQPEVLPKTIANYGLDLAKVFEGQEFVSNYNITVDESVLSLWSGFMPTASYTENSREFAGRLGFHQIFLPYGFLMNLTLSLCSDSYSDSSTGIVEIRNLRYINPAFPGDTFSCSVRIIKIAGFEESSIVTAEHILFNQKGETVFVLESDMLFPRLVPRASIMPARKMQISGSILEEKIYSRVRSISMHNKIDKFEPGDLILHPYVRPVGKSENLFWATYLKDTTPNHFNYQRYNPGEIVVSDGIVFSMVLSIAAREFRQILLPNVLRSFMVEPVIAEDRIGAFSYVTDVRYVMPGFEEIFITSFGLRNVDTETELGGFAFPHDMFDDSVTPENAAKLFAGYCPHLKGKICSVSRWKVLRKCEL
jgi:hypothetical protein